jgi:hypothetical protein
MRERAARSAGPDRLSRVQPAAGTAAKKLGIRVFYYIAPQVWAWRRGRIRKIRERVDRMGVVFPFEPNSTTATASASRSSWATRCSTSCGRARDAAETRAEIRPRSRGRCWRSCPAAAQGGRICCSAGDAGARRSPARRGLAGRSSLWRPVSRRVLAIRLGRGRLSGGAGRHLRRARRADAAVVASGTATSRRRCSARPMVIVYRVAMLDLLAGAAAGRRRHRHAEHHSRAAGLPGADPGRGDAGDDCRRGPLAARRRRKCAPRSPSCGPARRARRGRARGRSGPGADRMSPTNATPAARLPAALRLAALRRRHLCMVLFSATNGVDAVPGAVHLRRHLQREERDDALYATRRRSSPRSSPAASSLSAART